MEASGSEEVWEERMRFGAGGGRQAGPMTRSLQHDLCALSPGNSRLGEPRAPGQTCGLRGAHGLQESSWKWR